MLEKRAIFWYNKKIILFKIKNSEALRLKIRNLQFSIKK